MFLTELIAKGGPVLYLLFTLTLFILYIVINKYFFILSDQKHWYKNRFEDFINNHPSSQFSNSDLDKTIVSEFKRISFNNIKFLDGLIGMCPMIGLLGTVYGMIEVFEVLSFLGTGNPRAMSSGVAMATIPTMAAMVITLFGLFFRQDIHQRLTKLNKDLKDDIKSRGYSY